MDKKIYLYPQTEVHEVRTAYLMNTPGISGTGSGSGNDGGNASWPQQAPERRVF